MSEYLKQRQAFILSGRPLPEKKLYKLNPVSEKRKQKLKEQGQQGSDSIMDIFFSQQRQRMVGKCLFCGSKTTKDDDEKYHFSIAHLLPKRPADKGGFPSVATHEDNWIELCFWGNDCHGNFDHGYISWEYIKDSKEWEIIREKLLSVLPMVAEEERKNKLYDKLINLIYAEK